MEVLVVQLEDKVIGVASTQSKVMELISDYIGEDEQIVEIQDVRDSGIEFICKVYNHKEKYSETITVFYFTVDEI